jgi:hypothetical protein
MATRLAPERVVTAQPPRCRRTMPSLHRYSSTGCCRPRAPPRSCLSCAVQSKKQSSLFPPCELLSLSLFLTPPLLAQLPLCTATLTVADRANHRCWCRQREPGLRHHAVSPSASEAASQRDRVTTRTGHFIHHMELTVDNHFPLCSSRATALMRIALARCPSSSPTQPPRTTSPRHHRRSPTVKAHCRRPPRTVSLHHLTPPN